MIASSQPAEKGASFTAILVPVESLPTSAEDAERLLNRISATGAATVLVGPPRADIIEITEVNDGIAHAWLPTPVEMGPLVTAIKGALNALSLRAELAAAQRQVKLKEAEAQGLYEVGTALGGERNIARLQDLILRRCRELTIADAGSVYLVDEDENKQKLLRFETSQNDSIQMPTEKFSMPLNDRSIAGYAALKAQPVNIEDVYHLPADAPYGFNKGFDERMGYRTKSMLTVPLADHEGEIIGVIQLINHKSSPDIRLLSTEIAEREVMPFPPHSNEVLGAFAGQAAIALNNQLLISSIEQLFEGFVRASITAIEARDPTTSGHSERVAELTVGIAEAVNDIGAGRWKDVHFTGEQIKEIRYAGLLHDFGKIGVRENVLVKANKLYDWQLDVIQLRFGYVKKALEAEHSREKLALLLERDREAYITAVGSLDTDYNERLIRLDEDLAAVVAANQPTVLAQEAASRLADIAVQTYFDHQGREQPMLDHPELLALSVKRGSLTEKEREEIESHVVHTYKFLSLMPWTRQFKQLPLIAGAHHERLDGTGYPHALKADEIPVQSKMMAIADIYDALTAADRPYKKAVPVETALDILTKEVQANHIDPELFDIFIKHRVFDIAVAVTMRQAQQTAPLAGLRA